MIDSILPLYSCADLFKIYLFFGRKKLVNRACICKKGDICLFVCLPWSHKKNQKGGGKTGKKSLLPSGRMRGKIQPPPHQKNTKIWQKKSSNSPFFRFHLNCELWAYRFSSIPSLPSAVKKKWEHASEGGTQKRPLFLTGEGGSRGRPRATAGL